MSRSLRIFIQRWICLCQIFLFAFLLFQSRDIHSAACNPTLEWPVDGAKITSDFGPRKFGGFDFHRGIDFAASKGTPVKAVEGGIVNIRKFTGGGWGVEIKSADKIWWYMHMFSTPPSTTGDYKLETDPNDGKLTIKGPDGKELLESGDEVKKGDIIGPVGDAGVSPDQGPHLHLQVGPTEATVGKDSPFCYVKHPESNFTVQIEFSPPSLPESCPPQTCGFAPIKATVDSTTGLDLDKVKIFIDGSPVEFRFGGRPNEGASNNALKDGDSGEEKVEPQDADRAQAGVQPGLDKFVLPPKKFCVGKHTIEVKAYNVLNHEKPAGEGKLEFEIKEPPLQRCDRNPWQPEEPIEFASQKEGCFALGFASIHDFPYCMYEETAMNVGPTCSAGLFCCPEVRALAEAVSRPLVWDVPRCFADGLDSEWSPVVKKYAALWWKYHKWRYVINLLPGTGPGVPRSHLGDVPHEHQMKTATLEMALYKPSTETHEGLATITGSVISSGGKITKIEYRVDKSSYWVTATTSTADSGLRQNDPPAGLSTDEVGEAGSTGEQVNFSVDASLLQGDEVLRALKILPEGVHLVEIAAYNEAGENVYAGIEVLVRYYGEGRGLPADAHPPVTEVKVAYPNAVFNKDLGTIFVSSPTEITLLANDPVLFGDTRTASGIDYIEWSVDGKDFRAYDKFISFGPVAPFTTSFILSPGLHVVTFFAVDKAGAREGTKVLTPVAGTNAGFFKGTFLFPVPLAQDQTAPVSEAKILSTPSSSPPYKGGEVVLGDETIFVRDPTEIKISAFDPLRWNSVTSGIDRIEWSVDGVFFSVFNDGLPPNFDRYVSTAPFAQFTTSFILQPGTHTVTHFAVDKAGNEEKEQKLALLPTRPDLFTILVERNEDVPARRIEVSNTPDFAVKETFLIDNPFSDFFFTYPNQEPNRRYYYRVIRFQSWDGEEVIGASGSFILDTLNPVVNFSAGEPKLSAPEVLPSTVPALVKKIVGVEKFPVKLSGEFGWVQVNFFAVDGAPGNFEMVVEKDGKQLGSLGEMTIFPGGDLAEEGHPFTGIDIRTGQEFFSSTPVPLALQFSKFENIVGIEEGVGIDVPAGTPMTLQLEEGKSLTLFLPRIRITPRSISESGAEFFAGTPPSYVSREPLLFVAADGSTYFDSVLLQLAHPAPAPVAIISSKTPLTITAEEITNGLDASGIKQLNWVVNGRAYSAPFNWWEQRDPPLLSFTTSFTLSSTGTQTITFFAIDNFGNLSRGQGFRMIVDDEKFKPAEIIPPGELVFNEIAPAQTGGADVIEFKVTKGGNFSGYKVYELMNEIGHEQVKAFPIKTFPNAGVWSGVIPAGTFILLKFNTNLPDETEIVNNRITIYAQEDAAKVAPGLVATDNALLLSDEQGISFANGIYQSGKILDFVCYADQNFAFGGSGLQTEQMRAAIRAAVEQGRWALSLDSRLTALGNDANAVPIPFDCVSSRGIGNNQSVARDPETADSGLRQNDKHVGKYNWSFRGVHSLGAENGNTTSVPGLGTGQVSPSSVSECTKVSTFSFTYAAANPNSDTVRHMVTIAVPEGWPAPQVLFSTAPGYVSSNFSFTSGFGIQVREREIILPVGNLSNGQKVTVNFSNVPVPPRGNYTFLFQSDENGVNVSSLAAGSPKIFVVEADTVSPKTELRIASSSSTQNDPAGQFRVGTQTFISTSAVVVISASDAGEVSCGLRELSLTVHSPQSIVHSTTIFNLSALSSLSSAFFLTEGEHRIEFFATDLAGNVEKAQSVKLFVDTTPPVSQLSVIGKSAIVAGKTVIATSTLINISAADVISNGIASGVRELSLTVHSPSSIVHSTTIFNLSSLSSAFTLSEGIYTIEFFATDNVGNVEATKSVTVKVDATPPSAVELSAVSGANAGEAVLTWSAPGDDGNIGIASLYDLRFAITPINSDADFATATQITLIPAPKPSGSQETLLVTGLDEGVRYYFALKSADAVGNVSPISNSPSVIAPVKELVINEVAPAQTGGQDVIEFKVTKGGNFSGYKVYELMNEIGSELVKTFPVKSFPSSGVWSGVIPAGTFILLKFNTNLPDETEIVNNRITIYAQEDAAKVAPGLVATDNALLLSDASGIAFANGIYQSGKILDFVCYADQNFAFGGSGLQAEQMRAAIRAAVEQGKWALSLDSRLTALGNDANAVPIPFDCVSSRGIGNNQSVARDPETADSGLRQNDKHVGKYNWSFRGVHSLGAENGNTTSVPGLGKGEVASSSLAMIDGKPTLFAGHKVTLALTYTAANPNTDTVRHMVTIAVPEGWPAPQVLFSTAPGYVSSPFSFTSGFGVSVRRGEALDSRLTTLGNDSGGQALGNDSGGQALGNDSRWEIILPVGNLANGQKVTVNFSNVIVPKTTGSYSFNFFSDENGVNVGPIVAGSPVVFVVEADTVPPKTELRIDSSSSTQNDPAGQFRVGTQTFINATAQILLSAKDPEINGVSSGVRETYFTIDDGFPTLFLFPFTLSEGARRVSFFSRDNAGNTEPTQVRDFRVDGTSPMVRMNFVGGVQFRGLDSRLTPLGNDSGGHALGNESGGDASASLSMTSFFVSGETGYKFEVEDTTSNGVNSGANRLEVSVDSAPFIVYPGTFAFLLPQNHWLSTAPFSEGTHLLKFRGADNVDNVSVDSTVIVNVDKTGPKTELRVEGLEFRDGSGKIFIHPTSTITITSSDPISNGVASGVKKIEFRVNGGDWKEIATPFGLAMTSTAFTLPEGIHTIEFFATDNVGNSEQLHSETIYVDGTPPVTMLTISSLTSSAGTPTFFAFGTQYISPKTVLTLSATDLMVKDVASGVSKLQFTIDDLRFEILHSAQNDLLPLTTAFALPLGTHTITFFATDNVGNSELLNSKTFFVTVLPEFALVGTEKAGVTGRAVVSGDVRTNGSAEIVGRAQVLGSLFAEQIELKGISTVTVQAVETSAKISSVPIELVQIASVIASANDNAKIGNTSRGTLALDSQLKFKLSNRESITLSSGIYYFKEMELSGQSELNVSGNVSIFIDGAVKISGKSRVNATGELSNLVIFVDREYGKADDKDDKDDREKTEVKVAGESEIRAIVYAPFSEIEVSGKAKAVGHYFAKEAEVSGDSSLSSQTQAVELVQLPDAKKGSAAPASVPITCNDVFGYPNPAYGGQKPTIRIDCGIVDSLELRFHNVGGRLLHEAKLEGEPKMIDGRAMYEYTWDASGAGSGVYLVMVVLRKAGSGELQLLRKIAVVR